MRHLVDYPLRRDDFRQLIIICRGGPFQFPPQHINKLSTLISLPATEIAALFDVPRKRLEGRSSEKGDRLAYTVTDASRER